MKIIHDYKCDKCGKPAIYNFQNSWNLFSIDNDGIMDNIKTYEGDENEFWCEKCYNKEYYDIK